MRATRSLSIADFPKRHDRWTYSTLLYLRDHHIETTFLEKIDNVYPTDRGICYLLDGEMCYQERITDTVSFPARFYAPPGAPIGNCVFAPHLGAAWVNPLYPSLVILTEGTTDALAVAQHGVQAIALMGAKPGAERMGVLRHLVAGRTPVLIPDNDVPGLELAHRLRSFNIGVRMLPRHAKDICDLNRMEQSDFLHTIWEKLTHRC